MRKVVRDSKLEITCEGCNLITGKSKVTIPHLEGRSNKLRASVFGGISPEDQKWNYNFVVSGSGKIIISAKTAKAGTLNLEINV